MDDAKNTTETAKGDDDAKWIERDERHSLRAHTASIVTALITAGHVRAHDVSSALREVHATLAGLGQPKAPAEAEPALEPLKPAVPVKKSVTDEHIVSLIDGSKLKTLARHLTKHGYTPDSYRAAYGLPADYPMVAAAFSRRRGEIAKAIGLGRKAKQPKAA